MTPASRRSYVPGQKILRRLTDDCLRLFDACLQIPGLSAALVAWFEESQAHLRWWSFSIGAQRPGRASLDFRLRDHDRIRGIITNNLLALISDLGQCLVSAESTSRPRHDDDGFLSDEPSSLSSGSEVADDSDAEQHAPPPIRYFAQKNSIKASLHHLIHVSVLIRKSGDKFRHARADKDLERVERESPRTYAAFRTHLETVILFGPSEYCLLSFLDSAAGGDAIPTGVRVILRSWLYGRLGPIQQRLIEANVIRRHRMMLSRKEGRPDTSRSTEHQSLHRLAVLPRNTTVQRPAGVETHDLPPPVAGTQPPSVLPARPMEGSSAIQTATAIGPALDLRPERSARASSTMSKLTRTGEKQDYPKRSVLQDSPVCPYCGVLLEKERSSEEKWQGHVAHDLSPYTCIFDDCKEPYKLYATREQWTAHLRSYHSATHWSCSDCLVHVDTGDNTAPYFDFEFDFREHMITHHSDYLSPDELALNVKLCGRSTIRPVSCPLCLNDRNMVDVEDDDHIVNHLHSFSLRALPWDYNLDDGLASAGSSDSSPTPGLSPMPFDEDSDSADYEGVVQDVMRLVHHDAAHGEQEITWRQGLEQESLARLNGILPGLLIVTGLSRNQKDKCSSLLGRLRDNLGQLSLGLIQDKIQVEDLCGNITLDISALEECIYETPRRDHDLWQEALQGLPEKSKQAVDQLIAGNRANFDTLPAQLDKLLTLGWVIQDMYGKDGDIERGCAEGIARSLQQIGDDESIFLTPHTDMPWAVIQADMELIAPGTLPDKQEAGLILWVLDLALRAVNRGRILGLAYTLENTPEEAYVGLRFALLKLYTAVLEAMKLISVSSWRARNTPDIGRAMANSNLATGPIRMLFRSSKDVDDAVRECAERLTGTVDPETVALLEDLPLIHQIDDDQDDDMDYFEDEDEQLDRLEWISPPTHSDHHENYNTERTTNTCEWLLQHEAFRAWERSSQSAILWLRGSPGTGKTMISSRVVNYIKDTAEDSSAGGFAFFYCGELNTTGLGAADLLLRSLVRQLIAMTAGRPPSDVAKLLRRLDEGRFKVSKPSTGSWAEWLLEAIDTHDMTTLVLDGLDKLEPSVLGFIANSLRNVLEFSVHPVRIFLSSRENREIRRLIESTTERHSIVLPHWLKEDQTMEEGGALPHTYFDIASVIRESWANVPLNLYNQITRESEGSFLWAKAAARESHELYMKMSPAAIGTGPVTIAEVYSSATAEFEEMTDHHKTNARTALMWVSCVCRPLTQQELAEIFCLASREEGLGVKPSLYPEEEDLRDLWPSVLVLDTNVEVGVEVWRLSHSSVAQYFSEPHTIGWSLLKAHTDAAKLCLSLLLEAKWEEDASTGVNIGDSLDVAIRSTAHPLQTYARNHWVRHVKAVEEVAGSTADPLLIHLLKKFLGSPTTSSARYQGWYQLVRLDQAPKQYPLDQTSLQFIAPETQTLFAMCRFSLFGLLKSWWEDRNTLNLTLLNRDGKALLGVVEDRREESLSIGRRLVEIGANVNRAVDTEYGNALTQGAAMGNLEWVRLLLSKGALIGPTYLGNLGSPLAAAAYYGHMDIVKLLLSHGADVNLKHVRGRFANPLSGAALSGKPAMVQFLIDSGAKVEQLPDTMVAEVAASGAAGSLQILIKAGMEVNQSSPSGIYGSALAAAAGSGQLGCLEVLLDAGADVNKLLEGYSGSALCEASLRGDLDCLDALIQAGADVNRLYGPECSYGSALQAAAFKGKDDCLVALIEAGAAVDQVLPPRKFGSTALATAAFLGELDCLQALIENGANVNAPQSRMRLEHFGTALVAAICGKTLICVQTLIDAGADINAPLEGGIFGSALAAAAGQARPNFLKTLIQAGADVNQRLRTGFFGSALSAAAWFGDVRSLEVLLLAGADPNLQPESGSETEFGSPLVAAACMAQSACAYKLVEGGADVNLVLGHGVYRTALQATEAGPPPGVEYKREVTNHRVQGGVLMAYLRHSAREGLVKALKEMGAVAEVGDGALGEGMVEGGEGVLEGSEAFGS